ncbi:MAG: anthranilate synthase component II [Candidatus Dormibacteria bacterium]
MILVVDHQDSFVYNLVQLLAGSHWQVEVVSSTAVRARELVARQPQAVVLSPGPGRPERAGCFEELIRILPVDIPLLGVCLGHQALATALGAKVVRSPIPVHGKASAIRHCGSGIFQGLASPLTGGRYHSLVVDPKSLPQELEVTASTEDGLVMGLAHRCLPRFGVQFHPESILTPRGPDLIARFLSLVPAQV